MSFPSTGKPDDALDGGSELRRASRRLSKAIARSQIIANHRRGSSFREDEQEARRTCPSLRKGYCRYQPSEGNTRSPATAKWGRLSRSGSGVGSSTRINPLVPTMASQQSTRSVGESALEQHRRQEINRSTGRVDTKETPRQYGAGTTDFGAPFDWQARASRIHSTWKLSPRQRRQASDYRSDGYQQFKKELHEAASSFRSRNPESEWEDPFEVKPPPAPSVESVPVTPQPAPTRVVFAPVGARLEGYVEHTIFIPAGGWRDITFVPDVPDGIELIPCSIYLPPAIGNGLDRAQQNRRDSYSVGNDGSVVRRRSAVQDASVSSPSHGKQQGSQRDSWQLGMNDGGSVPISEARREEVEVAPQQRCGTDNIVGYHEAARDDYAKIDRETSPHRMGADQAPTAGCPAPVCDSAWHSTPGRPPEEGGEESDDVDLSPESEYVSVMSSPYSDSLDGRWPSDER